MSAPQTAQVIPLPIPVKGMNTRDPLASMDPNYAPWVLGYEPEPQYLRARNGHLIHATLTDETAITALVQYGDSALFAYAYDSISGHYHIYNVTTAGNKAQAVAVDIVPDDVAVAVETVKFAKRLAFLAETSPALQARTYDGSSWAAWGFTNGGTEISATVAASYKGRVYICYGTDLYYSALAAVTGACTKVDMSTLFREAGTISWIGCLTTPSKTMADTLLAIGNTAGEILIYAGDNPGATNWQQVAQFKTSRPLSLRGGILEHRNDIYILTETGIVSLRNLFTVGSSYTSDINISGAIDSYWVRLLAAIKANIGSSSLSKCSLEYWPEQNKIYVLMRGYIDRDGVYNTTAGTLFALNEISGAWTISLIPDLNVGTFTKLVYFKNGLYYMLGKVVMKVGTGYKDQKYNDAAAYSGITYALESAYSDLGSAYKNKIIGGFEPIMKTDFTGTSVTMKAAADFGRKVSTASTQPLLSGYQIPTYSVGAEGRFIQYRIEGVTDTASTTGLELYSMGAIVKT
jgi:hypothetical protein